MSGGKFECLLLHFGSMFGHDQPCLLMQHHLKVGKNFLDFIELSPRVDGEGSCGAVKSRSSAFRGTTKISPFKVV